MISAVQQPALASTAAHRQPVLRWTPLLAGRLNFGYAETLLDLGRCVALALGRLRSASGRFGRAFYHRSMEVRHNFGPERRHYGGYHNCSKPGWLSLAGYAGRFVAL